jgi:hypothetical protein
MTSLEMHIEVNQGVQKIAANLTREFLTEEIDWVLNKIQERFIRSCIRPVEPEKHSGKYTFVDQLRADSLKALVVSGKQLPAYGDPSWSIRQKVILPKDYAYLMSDTSEIALLCGKALTITDSTVPLTFLKLVKTNASSAPYYAAGVIDINGTTLTIPADLGMLATYTGLQAKEDVTLLVDFILNFFWKAGVEVYWEKYGEVYKQGQFIIPNASAATLSWDGVAVTATTVQNYAVRELNRAGVATITTDNRLMPASEVATYLNTPFFTSSSKGPISELSSNILYVYRDNNCTVKSVRISYIRKPQPISLLLGNDCELSSEVHQLICDLTVEYLKKVIESPSGNVKTQDIETRVII